MAWERKDTVMAIIAIVSILAASYFAHESNSYQSQMLVYQSQANYFQSEAYQLQNFQPKVFVFAPEWLRVNISRGSPNGNGSITVLIASPHSGYFTVTQLGFGVSSAAFLDRSKISSDYVHLVGDDYYFPVAAGVTSTRVTVIVYATAAVQNGMANFGDLGTMVLGVTFHDAYTNNVYSNSTDVPVLVVG